MGAKKTRLLIGPIDPCAIGIGSSNSFISPFSVAPIYNQVAIAPIQYTAVPIVNTLPILSAAPTLGYSGCGYTGLGTLGSYGYGF